MAELLNKFKFSTGKGSSIQLLYKIQLIQKYLQQMSGHKI